MFGRSIGLIISRLVQWEFRFDPGLYHEGYSGVVLKTWSVKVVVTVRSSGRFPAQPRSAPAGRLAWWDGVSHVVTRPAREHVT